MRALGGPGSGNFGHAGRPGHVGGSATVHHIGVPTGIDTAIAKADGGFTYHAVTGKVPTEGFALSLHQDREQILDAKDVNIVTLAQYAAKNNDLLSQPNNYFGGWHNPVDDKVYLDVSTVVDSSAEAERLGMLAKQYAYYDLKNGTSVKIEGRRYAIPQARTASHRPASWIAYAGRSYRARASLDGAGTDARGNRESQASPSLTVAGGPGSGNFGHAGRPGQIGGSSKTFLHGTAEAYLHNILKEGLKASEAGGVWAGSHTGHVYATTRLDSAKSYAQKAADQLTGGGHIATPAVLEIEVPAEHVAEFVADDHQFQQGDAFMHAGDIPPEWIKGAWTRKGPFKHERDHPEPWIKVLAASRTFYVALVLRDADERLLGGPGSGNFGHAGRPGEVGGSAQSDHDIFTDTSAAAMKNQPMPANLVQAENRIRHEKREHGYTMRVDDTAFYDGNDQIDGIMLHDIPREQIGTTLDPYKDAVFTHNHPRGYGLSPDDVMSAVMHNMKEVRAVGSHGVTHIATREGDRWPEPETLLVLATGEISEVQRDFEQQIRDGKMTIPEAERRHWPEVWARVSRIVNQGEHKIRFTTEHD